MRYFKPESVIQEGQKLDSLCDLEKLNIIGKGHKINIEEGKIRFKPSDFESGRAFLEILPKLQVTK